MKLCGKCDVRFRKTLLEKWSSNYSTGGVSSFAPSKPPKCGSYKKEEDNFAQENKEITNNRPQSP
jgi:hypothetical protein